MMTRELKHYFGRFSGRLAGIPNWRGGHFLTSDFHVQKKIENHPMFLAGLIEAVDEKQKHPPAEERSTSVDLDTMPWVELLKLARSLGFEVKGKKRVELIAELKEQ